MPSLKQSIQLVRNMGMRYTTYRIGLEVQKKLGAFKKKFPQNPPVVKFISLDEWRKKDLFWGVKQGEAYANIPSRLPNFDSYVNGEFPFFSADILSLGSDYDWITNPDTGHSYDIRKHWSEIQDYSKEAGDIKFVWEKSRFAYLYDVIRHDLYTGEDHSQWIFDEIKSWLKANPVNSGPNYKCSQEISLRVLNWTYALNYYKNSNNLTEELFQDIMHAIYWQLKHVYANINFSRIAVRNNHAITETLTLYLGALFYSFYPEASVWKKHGKRWFEQEIEYQIYPDGTFLQFSMNYHRVVIQLLTWAFKTADYVGEKFKEVVYERAYESLKFLYACQDEATGWLPNYGSNDGALFFKLNACDYRNYRPQLNALHVLLTGQGLYDTEGDWNEDLFWFRAENIQSHTFRKLFPVVGWQSFKDGGYFVLREGETITFIRCGSHKDRPAQADNLHLDIWHKGVNVLFDGGSYKYNTDQKLLKYFMGTESHNTVMLGDYDQMLKGSRFIWFNWSQSLGANAVETDESYIFNGEVSAFTYLKGNISHRRYIRKVKDQLIWEIEDTVQNKPVSMIMKQYWHCLPVLNITSWNKFSNAIDVKREKGLRSDYYGRKEDADQFVAETETNFIKTIIKIQ